MTLGKENWMAAELETRIERILALARAPGADGRTFPYEGLTDSMLFAFERSTFFGRAWQALAFEAELAEPGQRVTAMLGEVPVVVARGRDGELRGFVNLCRHRGYPVAEEDGTGPLLLCRYHGWSYGLDGCLLRAPEAEGQPGFDRAAHGLLPISVSAWRGVVFANTDPDAPLLEEAHPGLTSFGTECGFNLSTYRPFRSLRLMMPGNWKLLTDNVVECYHCASMHARTLTSLYKTGDFAGARWEGQVRHSASVVAGGRGRHDCMQIIPGTFLTADVVIGIVGRFVPRSPTETELHFRFAAAPAADPEEAVRFADVWAATLEEDRTILERQSVGLASGRLAAGVLVSGPETCLARARDVVLNGYEEALAHRRTRSS